MVRGSRLGWLLILPLLVGCRDDHAVADGTAGGTESGTGESADDGMQSCNVDSDCDDGSSCEVRHCDAGICVASSEPPPLTNECRPAIDVDYPPRAATVRTNEPVVTVTGTAFSPGGSITGMTINGESVTVAENGSFSHDVATVTGGNTLVLEISDSHGRSRKRVQSFLWSPEYRKPTSAPQGIADLGLAFWLAQETVDDGNRNQPYNDVASLLWLVLDQFDPSTVINPDEPIAHEAYYDIYILDIRKRGSDLSLQVIDNGLSLYAQVNEIIGDLYFDCTSWQCWAAGGDSDGGFSIQKMELEGDVILAVNEDNRLVATLANVKATIDPDDVEVWSNNGWTNFLISVAEWFIKDQVVADLEAALEQNVKNLVGPALGETIGGLALATNFEFPALGGDDPIVVQLFADFRAVDLHDGVPPPDPSPPHGGVLGLRAGGYAAQVVTPYDNLGVPLRESCGLGNQKMIVPREAPLEIALGDDMLNQLLYAGWRGGLLELPVENASATVLASGMLAPTASDCSDDGKLRAHIGDMHIDASVKIVNKTIDFEAYTSLVLGVDIAPAEDGISLEVTGIERIDTELTAKDDANIPDEKTLIDLLESQLAGLLIDGMGNGLGSFSLPPIDLSGALNMPPGSAMVEIKVTDVTRIDGATLLSGHL